MLLIPRQLPTVVIAGLAVSACADTRPVTWRLDNLEFLGGHPVMVAGDPQLIDTPHGKAIEFDGIDDGIFLDLHPLAGKTAFTVEIVFKPYRNGAPEQRFFYMQEYPSQEAPQAGWGLRHMLDELAVDT